MSELTKSIVYGIGIGFLSCIGIGIGIAKTISQVNMKGQGDRQGFPFNRKESIGIG